MRRYRVGYSDAAQAQLLDLYRYVASEADPHVAYRFAQRIKAQCEKLGTFPLRGTPRDDLMPGLRTLSFERRVVIGYIVDDDAVWIVGVSYGGRDLAGAFEGGL
ncbi:type II toxin-antitoxin system RelE/ParE family toxin [Sphingomonas sp. MG17]|uniref:Type II toxin-antitoxin system RelE/ParE family toxin n=1 Tax=Sphingomonas tagetis TaxID=2949092 RepID=A0A9X2HGT5_9SPHN|nr:type II toxin-antitoxin system RelE/ParE family toxin [Sphingomonas tagetis]MCP3728909.1 type II toxin-antitoxin system RelE/ParE family toxin [Sphingomonas tagetis]